MADVYTRIGYIKGDTGATGAQGAKGDTGDAATIQVGSVTTVPYGQTANVVNSGTEQAAVFDFTIPQGKPGQQTTEMDNLALNSITTSSASFPIPAVGETGKVLWGKVTKWFSDMAALVATKLNAANVVNNLTTTASGYALDARQGKVLSDGLDEKVRYINYDGSQKVKFDLNLTTATMQFTKGEGTVAVYVEPGHTLSAMAFAVCREYNGTLGVTYVKGDSSNNTIGIRLSNGSYSGPAQFTLLYFTTT